MSVIKFVLSLYLSLHVNCVSYEPCERMLERDTIRVPNGSKNNIISTKSLESRKKMYYYNNLMYHSFQEGRVRILRCWFF